MAFNKFLTLTIPKLPKWIVIEKCKLEFKRREALKVIKLFIFDTYTSYGADIITIISHQVIKITPIYSTI